MKELKAYCFRFSEGFRAELSIACMTLYGYDKGTSIVCTGYKTPMDCCCWLKAYTKLRTKLIFIFLFVLG